MRGYIFGNAADASTWRVYVPAHCLVLSMRDGHLHAEINNADRSDQKIRDLDVPRDIILKARSLVDVQRNLDTHTGWARRTFAKQ